jgi:hypothetical protein
MIKDIIIPNANHISIAIAAEDIAMTDWKIYILNYSEHILKNVMITSSGSSSDGRVSATLRHFIDDLQPNAGVPFELIMPEMFALKNNFFVTYYIDSVIYDREIEFDENSISIENSDTIELINLIGVERFY